MTDPVPALGPSPRSAPYGRVFLLLALATGLELALSLAGVPRWIRNPLFLVLSLAKAGLVVSFFMHLRGDARFYSYVFVFPAILIVLFILLTLAV